MSYKLLFIEDDSGRAEGLRLALEQEGHGLLVSADAAEALRALEQYRPDLVVIGSNLPGTTAAELCRKIHETTNAENIPIVIAGDHSDPDAISQLAQSGCDQVIEAPVTAKRLLEVCGELLESNVTDETVPTNSPEDGRLDADELLSAMGQFESILDGDEEEDDESESSKMHPRSRAAARGDFSELLDEVNVDQPPGADRGDSAPVVQPETDDELSLESELGRAFSAVTEAEPVRTTDEGQDIEDHLDTLFSGRGAFEKKPSDAAPAPIPTPSTTSLEQDPLQSTPFSAPEPTHEALAPTNALKTTQPMTIQSESAPSAPEPTQPTLQPAAVEPVPPVPAAHELFDPAEPKFHKSTARQKSNGSVWWIAAGFAIVVLVGGALLLFMRNGGSSNPTPEGSVMVDITSPSPPAPGATTPPVETIPPDATTIEETGSTPTSASGPPESVVPTTTRKATPQKTPSPTPKATTTRAATTPDRKTTSGTSSSSTTGRTTATASTAKPTKAAATDKPAATPETTTTAATDKPAATPKTTTTAATDKPAVTPETTTTAATDKPAATPETSTTAATDKPAATPETTTTAATDKPAVTPETSTTAATDKPAVTPETSTTAATDKPAVTPETSTTAATDKPAATPETSTTAATDKPAVTPATDETAATPAPTTTVAPPAAPDRSGEKPTPKAIVEDVKEPIVLERVEPDVPAKALHGRRGTVVLKVLVNEQGRIARVLVERGIPGSVLESAAINAVLRWRFQPATKDGQPVRAWTKATFDFGEK